MLPLNPPSAKSPRFTVVVFKRGAMAVLIVGAMLAGPSWLKWREQSKVIESHRYLECVRLAQERYHEVHGQFANKVCDLDMARPEPTFFDVGEFTPGCTGNLSDSWSLTLTRFGDAFLFGNYTVTFNQYGFDAW